ncbi:hypothetical protein E2320_019014 [Naja naja]|nr:hypothetical protein E2320_019014 [Naja naja]
MKEHRLCLKLLETKGPTTRVASAGAVVAAVHGRNVTGKGDCISLSEEKNHSQRLSRVMDREGQWDSSLPPLLLKYFAHGQAVHPQNNNLPHFTAVLSLSFQAIQNKVLYYIAASLLGMKIEGTAQEDRHTLANWRASRSLKSGGTLDFFLLVIGNSGSKQFRWIYSTVSLDSRVREVINRNLLDPNCHMYEDAQLQIYTLMHRDSFPRFLNSQIYKSLLESTRSSTSET